MISMRIDLENGVLMALLLAFSGQGNCALAKHPTRGLVVASTRLDTRCGTFAGLISIEDAQKAHSHVFLLSNHFVKKDFHDPPGYFISQEFEAGEWHILGVRMGSYVSDFSEQTGHTFTVKPGEAIYLGQLFVQPSSDCTKYKIAVSDEWERDLLLFQKDSDGISVENVHKAIL